MNVIISCVCILGFVGLVPGQKVPMDLKWRGELVIHVDTPPPPDSSILWKHNANKVVEYDRDFSEQGITAYGAFRGRATLDRPTGTLTVTSLTKADDGVYSVEYNSKPQPKTFAVSVLKTIPKPTITCSCEDDPPSCTLTCVANTIDAGKVSYSWKKDGEPLDVSEPSLKVPFKEASEVTCQLQNQVDSVESKPACNSTAGFTWGITLLAIAVTFIIIITAVAVLYIVREKKCHSLRMIPLFIIPTRVSKKRTNRPKKGIRIGTWL